MRLIGTLDDEKLANRFSAWLIAEGVENQLEIEKNNVQFWIKNEDQVERAKQELAAFVVSPNHPKYSDATARAAKVERDEIQRRKAYERNVVKVRQGKPSARTPLTITLIIISAAIALLTSFGKDLDSVWFEGLTFTDVPRKEVLAENVINKESLSENWLKFWSISHGEVWRLVTPIFIHFGTLHIVFNMIWLFQLGRLVENRYGTIFIFVLVIVSAAISNLVQVGVPVSWQGVELGLNQNGHVIAALGGMSGVVYALFGFVWIKSTIDPNSRFFVPSSTVLLMLGWLIFCMLPASNEFVETRNVANWAHGIGLLCGVIFAIIHTQLSGTKLPTR